MRDKQQVEVCCVWCQRPVRLCRKPSCDDADTYAGVASLAGSWIPVERERITAAASFSTSPVPG
jgi:hypothetical protein